MCLPARYLARLLLLLLLLPLFFSLLLLLLLLLLPLLLPFLSLPRVSLRTPRGASTSALISVRSESQR